MAALVAAWVSWTSEEEPEEKGEVAVWDLGQAQVTAVRFEAEGREVAVERHGLTVTAPHHRLHYKAVAVEAGSVVLVPVELRPLPGRLQVRSSVEGGSAWLDERLLGPLPVGPVRAAVGTHFVTVRAPGHRDWVLEIDVPPDGEVNVTATPEPEVEAAATAVAPPPLVGPPGKGLFVAPAPEPPRGRVVIRSRPPGAEVLLGEESLGRTPLGPLELAAGRHVALLRLAGHRNAQMHLEAAPGRTNVAFVRLRPLQGELAVLSTPLGANVFLNGKSLGTTPLGPVELAPGRHGFELHLLGYVTYASQVEVRPRELAVVNPTLVPAPAPPPPPEVARAGGGRWLVPLLALGVSSAAAVGTAATWERAGGYVKEAESAHAAHRRACDALDGVAADRAYDEVRAAMWSAQALQATAVGLGVASVAAAAWGVLSLVTGGDGAAAEAPGAEVDLVHDARSAAGVAARWSF